MPGKAVRPDQTTQAVALREAGFTVTAIADRLGISVSSVQRVLARHSTKKGAIKTAIIEQARKELVDGMTADAIKHEAATIIQDDLAFARMLRAKLAVASEHIAATNLQECVQAMRAGAACAVALKATSDMLRHTLRIDKQLEAAAEQDMPELIVRVISNEEAAAMTKEGAMDDAEDGDAILTES